MAALVATVLLSQECTKSIGMSLSLAVPLLVQNSSRFTQDVVSQVVMGKCPWNCN